MHSEISPFLGKFLISAIIIYALIYIHFLKERVHLISVTVSYVYRIRSYQRLKNKIGRIFDKEFGKSYSFLLYLKYRQFVFEIFEHQREQAEQDIIVNPMKPITKLFALKKFQDAFKKVFIQFWRLKYGDMNMDAIKDRLDLEEGKIPSRYFSRYRNSNSPDLNWLYPF